MQLLLELQNIHFRIYTSEYTLQNIHFRIYTSEYTLQNIHLKKNRNVTGTRLNSSSEELFFKFTKQIQEGPMFV